MTKNLMIVESPAKAKTIEKFLGSDFTVKSSYGHIRDLPKDDTAIDISKGYTPQYIVTPDKTAIVSELRKLAKSAQEVWLATDEDREGEAISWHLCEALNLDARTTKRIVFHEITKPAILRAVANPRSINQSLVDAQQARRVLDRLVGFEISPILWRKISRSNSLSAGRVQSVAVRLIVEREREIRAFVVTSHFKIAAYFKVKDTKGREVTFKAELPRKVEQEGSAAAFLQKCIGAEFEISNIETKPGKKTPPPPFTTSTLQQDASRKLSFSVKQTMSVAQKLYEAGHITYMRTDSTYLSDTALTAAALQIQRTFGDKYSQTRQFKTKSQLAQEAHEAIRPTYFENTEIEASREEQRLYDLIWKRTMASQMSDALLERTTANIDISTIPEEELVAKGEVIKFDGFLALYRESAIDEESEEEQEGMLPPLHKGQILDLKQMQATERFTHPPARFNEASLVKQLEELGIGRPSTYAPTISTIQQRGYVERQSREGTVREYRVLQLTGPDEPQPSVLTAKVEKEKTGVEKNKLVPTDIGMVVNDFLVKYFANIVDYHFTADIEKKFDEVAEGKKVWREMIDNFYKPFHQTVEFAMGNAERGTGNRQIGIDPKTGKAITARLGKFGPLLQIGDSENGDTPQYANIRPPFTIESITLEQALEMFKLPREVGDFEGKPMKVNEGRFGPYVQHDSKYYSLPKEADLFAVSAEQAIALIEAKRITDSQKVITAFKQDPDVQVLNGRFGPYIKAGSLNVKIPKNLDPKELTYEDCQKLIEQAGGKPEKSAGTGRGGFKKKTTSTTDAKGKTDAANDTKPKTSRSKSPTKDETATDKPKPKTTSRKKT